MIMHICCYPFYSRLFEVIKDTTLLDDLDVVSQLLRNCKRLRVWVEQGDGKSDVTSATLRHNIAVLTDAALRQIDQIRPDHIAEICDSLKRMGAYQKEQAQVSERLKNIFLIYVVI